MIMSNADLEILKSRLGGRLGLFSRSTDKSTSQDGAEDNSAQTDERIEPSGLFSPPVVFQSEDRPFWEVDSAKYPQNDDESNGVPHPLDIKSAKSPHTAPPLDEQTPIMSFAYPSPDEQSAASHFGHDFPHQREETQREGNDRINASVGAAAALSHIGLGGADKAAHQTMTPPSARGDGDYLKSFADPQLAPITAQQSAIAPQAEPLDNGGLRGSVFAKIITSDDDIIGMVAYSLYKLNKYDWSVEFHRVKGRMPNAFEVESFSIGESMLRRLSAYRQMAELMLRTHGFEQSAAAHSTDQLNAAAQKKAHPLCQP
jgi:hypothetical protein